MRIEDAFPDPAGGTAVTGRLTGGPVRRGDTLWLIGTNEIDADRTSADKASADRTSADNTSADKNGVAVEVRRFLRLCGRQDDEVAHREENAAIVLDGLPAGLTLIGLMLTSVPPGAQP
ncbi:hypothetical protein SAMN05421541_101209 [Actinoplanes philippinensis]|uniref:Uncharacterized protein n=1 Tax=Actinoplanes philippinensis TaxID=35752 RepID=A0A1I1ZPP9_9ACTN|nr:hypothetical protein [Actinoplanes philippinensis]SFE33308.1 hypothetical protein SAMN05421541_101209 [Actinoplanes philippinensis]